jgi:hypothetical protein
MKNLLFVVLAVFCINIQAQEAKTYAVKSGYIKYELGGSTKGTKEVWWDNYGTKTCEIEKSTTTTKVFGIKNTDEKNMATVIVKGQFWVADYIKNIGTMGKVPYYNDTEKYVAEMTEQEQKELLEQVLTQMGGKVVGTESLSGYHCDIIKLMGIKSWIHKGLVLKTEGKILGIETNEMFVDFKPNSKVSASKFNPPSGVQYDDMAEVTSGGLMGALGGMDAFEEEMEDDDDDWETVPVDYSFDKFSKIVKGCDIEGYRCARVNTLDGMHSAVFMKGLNTMVVIAQSDENLEKDDEEFGLYDSFRSNGHTCHYGVMEEDNGSALVVEYPSDDMIVTFMAMPQKSKDELVEIADKFDF